MPGFRQGLVDETDNVRLLLVQGKPYQLSHAVGRDASACDRRGEIAVFALDTRLGRDGPVEVVCLEFPF